MIINTLWGILLPFFGTSIGAAGVFFMKKTLDLRLRRALTGFAAGVMVAASVWSLLIPAMESWSGAAPLAFIPTVIGFWAGVGFLLLLDRIIPHLHAGSTVAEGPANSLRRTTMLVLAVVLHNIPEGMAVGVVFAGYLSGGGNISLAAAMALSLGIAIQDFPEGAIISMPLVTEKFSRPKAFLYSVLSGAVEPAASLLTLLLSGIVVAVLPYLLSFAAGAMMFVVVEELIPEMSEGRHSDIGVMMFTAGFTVMMALDVALG